MNKEEIINALKHQHELFISGIASLDVTSYEFAKEGKWNAGQTLDHLNRSVSALNNAMRLPKASFALLFGKANRPSKTYDQLVAKYKQKLADGGKAKGRYIPEKISFEKRPKAIERLRNAVNGICKKLNAFTEKQLDEYILPHPLLGKITLREMVYFTIYHAQHHQVRPIG